MDLQQRAEAQQLYVAAVGPKSDFYASKFIAFDTYDSSRISWNWPAFFLTFPWMLYRRMFGYAAVYFLLVPIVAWILSRVISVALPPELAPWFAFMLSALVFFIAPPMYANAMYQTTIAHRIRKVQEDATTLDEQVQALERQPSTSSVVASLGAALAITTSVWSWYRQDVQTVREDVKDGIAHSGYVQADLEQFYREHGGRWPRDGVEMNLDDFAKSQFVETMEVRDGDIRLTFGTKAVPNLQGKLLVLKPFISEPFRVDWVCVEVPTESKNGVQPRYWPRNCDSRDVNVR